MGEIRIKRDNSDWDNRPAHQFVNGQCVDIPTHHYTNGRWQGELTSQSPLKFRADGSMLDWRIEGKTSENLFDTSVYNNNTYRHNCTVSNTSNSVTITSTGIDPYSGDVFTAGTTIPAVARTMYMSVKPNTAYTIAMSSAPKCYITQIDAEHNSVSEFRITQNLFTFTTNSATRYIIIRLGDDALQVGESRTFENTQLVEGSYTSDTLPPYEPYGSVGDWDETEQKYVVPINVRGGNLYSGAWEQGFWSYDTGVGWGTDSKYVRTAKMPCEGNTKYEFVCSLPDGAKDYGFVFWNANGKYIGNIHSSDVQNTPVKYSATSPANAKMMAINIARYSDGERHPADILNFDLYELHKVNLYTDHQLLDGDSIDFTTDQTTIPLATGNNILTVDTAVQPKSVFVKFEG